MARHFSRAVRRAGIQVQYSKGYHPMPKISFDNPLPLGMESESEYLRIAVGSHHTEQELVQCINSFLPQGIKLLTCQPMSKGQAPPATSEDCYIVQLNDSVIDPLHIDEFQRSRQWDYTRIRHKGRSQPFNLKAVVTTMSLADHGTLELGIQSDTKPKARPADILRSVFRLSEEQIQATRIRKLKRCFNTPNHVRGS